MIKAMNTYYKGNYYRSRTEARWAVFFDTAGIQYIYEPEGFVLEDGSCYLPDFFLPLVSNGLYIEIKPGNPLDDPRNHPDHNRWRLLSKHQNLAILFGQPHAFPFWVLHKDVFLSINDGPSVFSGNMTSCLFHYERKLEGTGENAPYWRLWWDTGGCFDEDTANIPLIKKASQHRFEFQ